MIISAPCPCSFNDSRGRCQYRPAFSSARFWWCLTISECGSVVQEINHSISAHCWFDSILFIYFYRLPDSNMRTDIICQFPLTEAYTALNFLNLAEKKIFPFANANLILIDPRPFRQYDLRRLIDSLPASGMIIPYGESISGQLQCGYLRCFGDKSPRSTKPWHIVRRILGPIDRSHCEVLREEVHE